MATRVLRDSSLGYSAPVRRLICLFVILSTACSDDADSSSAAEINPGDSSDTAAEINPGGDSDIASDAASDAGLDSDAALPPPFDFCDELPTGPACFAERRAPDSSLVDLAVEIADRVLDEQPAAELGWDWGEAVMLVGLLQVARVTGDARFLDYSQAYLDHHIEDGYDITTSDTSAPAAVAVGLIAAGRDSEAYREVVDDALTYYREDALRTEAGGISHFGAIELLGVSLWADSLFMFGNVMTGWGEHDGDLALLDEYAEQYDIFAQQMQESLGFFVHADESPFEQTPDIYWGRANGWIAAAAYDHLRVRRVRGERLWSMEASAATLIDAAIAWQDPDSGLWWTVLNRPGETYLETSVAALFAFGMARGWRYGYLGDEVLPSIALALNGVLERVESDESGRPDITGVSGPTSVGTFDYYAGVPQRNAISYGIGAVLLALTEVSGLPLELE